MGVPGAFRAASAPGDSIMRQIEIQFTFDYIDPGSYLASRLLASWIDAVDEAVSVSWRPLELRIPPTPPPDPADSGWSEMTREIGDHARREKVPFLIPTRIPWTRKAHELAFHARQQGCFDPVHEALFEAHFTGVRDIGRIDVLVSIGAEHGLDTAEIRTVLGVDRFRSSVEAGRRTVLAGGVRGVPTLEVPHSKFEGFRSPGSFRAFLTGPSRYGVECGCAAPKGEVQRRWPGT